MDMRRIQESDPEMFEFFKRDNELNHECRALSMRFRRATGSQREEIKEKITTAVNKHFEVRQERRTHELQRLEKELDRLRSSIERRNEIRESIVGKRISQLLGEQDELEF